MDYEKKYNEALKWMRELYPGLHGATKEDAEHYFPELRESEDERMVREFNDWLCEEIECRTNDLRDEKDRRTLNMLCYVLTKVKDWFEKQKEQKPEDLSKMMVHKEPYVAPVPTPMIADEQKPADDTAFEKWLDDWYQGSKEAGGCVVMSEKEFKNWSRGIRNMYQQKPAKVLYIPKFRTGDLVRSSKNPRLTYEILSVGSMNELGNLEYEVEIFTDEKPDEPRNLKHIEIEKMDSWGELVKQKPAEWSEEDGSILNSVIRIITQFDDLAHEPTFAGPKWTHPYTKEIAWLKSLRPQPKAELTLLDENIIKAAVAFVEQNEHFNCWGGIDKHTVIKALRSLKPHWKPTEEQTDALAYAIQLLDDGLSPKAAKAGEELEHLREQLKKIVLQTK